MKVRPVRPDDAAAVAALLGELGYPVSPAVVAARLAERAPREADAAWVLTADEQDEGDAVGFVAGHVFHPYELDRPVAEITALVVSATHRRSGAATALVGAVEGWAETWSCQRITVASSLEREGAHAFYDRRGYRQLAKKLEKSLDPPPS